MTVTETSISTGPGAADTPAQPSRDRLRLRWATFGSEQVLVAGPLLDELEGSPAR